MEQGVSYYECDIRSKHGSSVAVELHPHGASPSVCPPSSFGQFDYVRGRDRIGIDRSYNRRPRAEQAALLDQIKSEAGLAAERRAAAALAAAANVQGAERTAALIAQRKAENDATFATARLRDFDAAGGQCDMAGARLRAHIDLSGS